MSCLGNVIWIILGGFIGGISWFLVGILWSVTIVGIPVGKQCFKIAKLSFSPFGKDVKYEGVLDHPIVNIFWIIFGGFELAIVHLISSILFAITIIGIPFAKQSLKLARLSLMPFGVEVVNK